MRICIPIPDRSMGGMYTFLRNFRAYLSAKNISITDDITDEYNVLFVNSFMVGFKAVFRAKRRMPKLVVVHRVDGSTRDYGRYDDADKRQARLNLLSDLTIFQSAYSKYSTRQKYKVIAQDGPIIYNPVDTQLFCSEGPHQPLPGTIRVYNASFSTNLKKGTWQISTLAEANPDIDFILCGQYPELPDLPNIHKLGHLQHKDLSSVIRSCDVALHLAVNDPCPNVVLEALASGLPVLYKDSGGSPELVQDCGYPVTVETFRPQLEALLKQRVKLAAMSRNRAITCFAPEIIFPAYLGAIEQAKRIQQSFIFRFFKALIQGYQVV